MARLTTTLLLLCALILGPALCLGGLLEHACECGSAASVACEHEQECPDDPCASVVRVEEHDAQANFKFAGLQVLVAVLALDAELASESRPSPSKPPQLPGRSNLPYAQSDRPQLI